MTGGWQHAKTAIERRIGEETGLPARIIAASSVGGGCINEARTIELADGRRLFVKLNAHAPPAMFEREAEGLAALANVGALTVPRPIAVGESTEATRDTIHFIVMEQIDCGRQGKAFFEQLGQGLAQLHRRATGSRFGFDHDNHIGSTEQPNAWSDDWVAFWRERRLAHQLALAARRELSDEEMTRLGERLMVRLDEIIGTPDEPACLLHGDLWSGNYLSDRQGRPVLIDPATYYGRREADLAMTLLFGGFDARFYAAYNEAWPLEPGSEERLEVYKLYHLLNHLNLFGGSYRASCMQILRRFA